MRIKKKRIIICIIVLILVVSLITIAILSKKKDIVEPKPQEKTYEKSSNHSDLNETVKPTKPYQESTSLVVSEKHENKKQQASDMYKSYRLADNTDKAMYEITNLKKSSDSKKTTISGKIKNNGGSKNIILKAEFNGKSKSSSSIEIKDLEIGQSKKFEIKILNNATSKDYSVYVEYVGE